MHHYFIKIHQFVQKNKVLAITIALSILLVFGFLASKIKFEEDITRIIPKNEKADVTAKVLQQLRFSDKITVIVEKDKNATVDDLTETADVFLDSVQSCSEYIKNIQGKVDEENIQETFQFVFNNLPLFLEDRDYHQIEKKLSSDSIAIQVDKNYRTLISPTGIIAKDFIINDPLGISFISLKKLQQLSIGDDFQLKNGYVVTKDESKLLLFINPKLGGSETEKNSLFAENLYNIKKQLNKEFKGKASVDYFGSSLIAVANAKQIKSDIVTTILASLGALMLILILFYRKIFIPVIIFIPTLFGIAVAIAGLVFLKGTISAISLSVGAVLLGVTIDYSLHIMTHYRHNSNVEALYKDITMPLLMSSSTTAVAFLCLLFVNSEALKDLGIFAAISVMVSAVFSLLIIPHLYKPKEGVTIERQTVLDKVAGFSFEKNKFLIISSVIVIAVSLFTFGNVKFNNNLADLNFIPSEIKNAENKLESSSNLTSKSIYLATYGNSIDEALKNNAALFQNLSEEKSENKILNFSSIGGIVLSQEAQNQKIEKWNSFWSAQRKAEVKSRLIASGAKLGFKPEAHQNFYDMLAKDFAPITFKEYSQLKALFLEEFVTEKNGFYTISSVAKVSPDQRDRFVSTMDVQKEVITIDRQQMNETFLGKLRDDFNSLINYSFIAVILILFMFFKRIELVIISTIPIAVTGVVTAGIMSWFDIQLNIFSLIVCTLIFGHGVDFSIFMTSALQKEYTTGKNETKTYRISIILAALTTVLAIGALIFAKHPALKSISAVSLIGVFAALIITFVFYPVLFRICFFSRVKKGNSPITFFTFIHSVISLIYYALGGILLSTFGRFLVKVLPGKPEKKMLLFRKMMAKFVTSVLYSNPLVKKQVVNKFNETFEKPAVVIANHTSVLDTLALGMVTHKIVYLVNDWVYKSPIFGKAVKAMGYYPVSQGIEGGVDHLKEKVEQGYSLMIFPEGTRSEDNVVKRFHKGAFFLAQEFNLDILPIYIHGNSETAPKGDFMIYNESISVVVGERIKADDASFGIDYTERTKKINKFYRQEFAKIRTDYEDENYFRQKLFLSFLYKEEEIVTAVKTDFKKNKALYFNLNKHIAEDACILHHADDFGQIDFLLAIQQPKRKIQSLFENEDNKAIASANYLVKKRDIKYIDNLSEVNHKFDTVLISDTHELHEEKMQLASKANKILLTANFELKSYFESSGFVTQVNNKDLIVLVK
ncbi:1-acyl-sn-glycerol-3-phosphate acyltransferase [Flavobacterium sp. H122]|uniref:1-acyl-sn-glycerol-3-phosphate acyltransferase n=1 Tax=Flavobacterium sp. H122 TaxID=2529860 RepID=UPI0010AAFE89|nr:1-acyl-sn-glycerol-3-phosphate acyltransferase [Flavobacterium sp. H122]